MSDAIIYCDVCNKIVLPSEVKDGGAIVTSVKSLCPDCLKRLPPEERAELELLSRARAEKGDSSAAESHKGRSTGHHRAARPARSSALKMTALAIALFALSAGATVALLVRDEEQAPAIDSPQVAPYVEVAAAPETREETTEREDVSAASGELEAIRKMVDPGLGKYGEIRERLESLASRSGDAPERHEARELLSEVDAQYAAVAEAALAAAMASANISASRGDFDGALSAVRSIASRFGEGPWLASTGSSKIASAVAEIQKKRDARRQPQVAEVRLAVQERSETGQRSGDRDRALAEFDGLMGACEYAKAHDVAESLLANSAGDAELAGMARAASKIAAEMAKLPAARLRGARTLVGTEARLRLRTGSITAVVDGVDEKGLRVVTTFTINNETRKRQKELAWAALRADQLNEFARLGGVEMDGSERAIGAAYEALASEDMDAAAKVLESAGGHPLAERLQRLVGDMRLESSYAGAIEKAASLVEAKRWRRAVAECEKALALKPGDAEARRLIDEVDAKMWGARTITLDLGGGVTLEFVRIKPGAFAMGGDHEPEHHYDGVEKPKHEVVITRGFYIGRYEVTQAQYEAVTSKNPSETREPTMPVEQVSWKDAVEFCRLLSERTRRAVRLPTEAEWEYAARAGADTRYCFGDDTAQLGEYAWYWDSHPRTKRPVGRAKPNAWGLYDVHGNVCEWVADLYDAGYYKSSPRQNPPGPTTGSGRILRGGGWTAKASACRCAARYVQPAAWRYMSAGFRAALSPAAAAPSGRR